MPKKTRTIQTACEAAGALAVATACFMIWLPLGLFVVGAMLLLVGNAKVGR
jgi:hypothetical protein